MGDQAECYFAAFAGKLPTILNKQLVHVERKKWLALNKHEDDKSISDSKVKNNASISDTISHELKKYISDDYSINIHIRFRKNKPDWEGFALVRRINNPDNLPSTLLPGYVNKLIAFSVDKAIDKQLSANTSIYGCTTIVDSTTGQIVKSDALETGQEIPGEYRHTLLLLVSSISLVVIAGFLAVVTYLQLL